MADVLSRDAVAEVLRRYVGDNIHAQTIDAIVALTRPENEVKAEALDEIRSEIMTCRDETAASEPFKGGLEFAAILTRRHAELLRSGDTS